MLANTLKPVTQLKRKALYQTYKIQFKIKYKIKNKLK